jgi:hypothetical protein
VNNRQQRVGWNARDELLAPRVASPVALGRYEAKLIDGVR